jgi:hypothetical protein
VRQINALLCSTGTMLHRLTAMQRRQPLPLTGHRHMTRQLAGGQDEKRLTANEDVRVVGIVVHLSGGQLELESGRVRVVAGRRMTAGIADRVGFGGGGRRKGVAAAPANRVSGFSSPGNNWKIL